MDNIRNHRQFLKACGFHQWKKLDRDQAKGVPAPPLQKQAPEGAITIDLVPYIEFTAGKEPIKDVIAKRRSRRKYSETPLNFEEISYLLWATQGVNTKNNKLRTSPSGGARHPFETYLAVNNLEKLKPGLYRYLPLDHKLLLLYEDNELGKKLCKACFDQIFIRSCAVNFIWTVIPYRTEWRYSTLSHKIIAIDVGHLCQNLYLASESIGGGTCAVGAYTQEMVDSLLDVEGTDEFTIYLAAVGKVE